MDDLKEYINALRRDFSLKQLDETTVTKSPYSEFEIWMKEAISAQVPDPNAMVLSTATADGKPSARVVLLRGFNEGGGFVFYTNYNSRKGREIRENAWAALTFFWPQLDRQVRIEGQLEKVTTSES